jgi:hypothetical protein
MASTSRSTTLRAGAACQRCRRGKTRCVYENGQPPRKNCAKGMHECYLPSEVMASSHTGSPARSLHRPRDSLPDRGLGGTAADRTAPASSSALPRSAPNSNEKYVGVHFPVLRSLHPKLEFHSLVKIVAWLWQVSGKTLPECCDQLAPSSHRAIALQGARHLPRLGR